MAREKFACLGALMEGREGAFPRCAWYWAAATAPGSALDDAPVGPHFATPPGTSAPARQAALRPKLSTLSWSRGELMRNHPDGFHFWVWIRPRGDYQFIPIVLKARR